MNADEIVKALRWVAKETDFKFAAETMNEAADMIGSLQAQLSASQRRADAAVECLNVLEPCEFCKHYDENCICARPLDYGNCFEWRGTQDEKGEAE